MRTRMLVGCVAMALMAGIAAAQDVDSLMGSFEGAFTDGQWDGDPVAAKIVARGNGRYEAQMTFGEGDDAMEALLQGYADHDAAVFIGTLGEGLVKLYPPQLERFGLVSRDRVTERSEHPLRGTCDRLAQIFAVERYDLYVYHPRYGNDVVVELTWPPALLVPAFVTSELKTAFQIGFLILIPFLVIDLVVASVLMSMGMMMLSPLIISLPFKIMLFVLIDGWALVFGTLASSFLV